jgi:hypothetical protein
VLNVEGPHTFIDVQIVYLAGPALSPSARGFADLTLSAFASKQT